MTSTGTLASRLRCGRAVRLPAVEEVGKFGDRDQGLVLELVEWVVVMLGHGILIIRATRIGKRATRIGALWGDIRCDPVTSLVFLIFYCDLQFGLVTLFLAVFKGGHAVTLNFGGCADVPIPQGLKLLALNPSRGLVTLKFDRTLILTYMPFRSFRIWAAVISLPV